MRALSALALRRALPPWLFLSLLGLLLVAARGSAPVPFDAPVDRLDERALAGLRALARQEVWSVLLAAVPLLLWQAARLGRTRTNAWIAPMPVAPLVPAVASLAGCALAALLVTLCTALVAEAAVPAAPAAWRRARLEANPPQVLHDAAPRARWSVPALAADERLRLRLGIAAGAGPAVTARLTARGPDGERSTTARVAGRTALELVPPAVGHGTLELELERLGGGALLVLPPEALEILAPAASERLTAVHLGSRVLLALVAGSALALGLARHLRPALAAAVVLALFLLAGTRPWLTALVPCADLPAQGATLAQGLVPAPAGAAVWLGAAGLTLVGLALQTRRATHAGDDP